MPSQIFGVDSLYIVVGLVALIIGAMGALKGKRHIRPELAGFLAFGVGFGLALWYLLTQEKLPLSESVIKALGFGLGIPLVHKIIVKPFSEAPGEEEESSDSVPHG